MKLEVKNGWFIEEQFDYEFTNYHGAFTSKKESKKALKEIKSKSECYSIRCLYLPYVQFENNIIPFGFYNYCEKLK